MSAQREIGYTASSITIYGSLGAASVCVATIVTGWYMSGLSAHGVSGWDFSQILLWSVTPHSLSEIFHRSELADQCVLWLYRKASWVPKAAGISASVGVVLGGLVGWILSTSTPDVIRGRRYLTDREGLKAVQREMKREAKWSGSGIHIHPDIQISRDRETRGLMVVGAIGSGKTVTLKHVIADIIGRGDKVLIYDNKGDFTSRIDSLVDDRSEVGLVAPWDKRSMRWSVAKDVRSETAARELATRLIPPEEGTGAQWTAGASLILGGLIATLAEEHKRRWNWSDLRAVMQLEYADLREMALRQNQSAAGVLPEEATTSTTGYLSVLTSSAVGTVSDLASADAEAAKRGARVWNTYDWMLGSAGPRIVVMQDSSQFSTIAQALGSAVIRAARGAISQMPESKTNRVWLVLDEFPQLGRVQGIDGIIDTGRSKGVCVVLGFQTKAKIDDIYGTAFADALLGNLGTQIYCRSGSAETRAWASDQIGQQEVRRTIKSRSSDATILQTQNTTTGFNHSEQIVTRSVVFDTDLADLGRRGDGVDAILVTGSGEYVAKVWWPFAQGWRRTAEPNVPAEWTEALGRSDEQTGAPIVVGAEGESSAVEMALISPDEGEVDFSQFDDFYLEFDVAPAQQFVTDSAVPAEPMSVEKLDSINESVTHHTLSETLDMVVPGAGAVVEVVDLLNEETRTGCESTAIVHVQPTSKEPERKKIRVRKKTVEPEVGI